MGYFEAFLYFTLILKVLVIHEAGHNFALINYKVPLQSVGLGFGPTLLKIRSFEIKALPLGAYVVPNQEKWAQLSPHAKMVVALAGPAANFTAALAILLLVQFELILSGFQYVAYMHLAMGAFNLIPFPPLDGWVVFKEWRSREGSPLSPNIENIAHRVANGFLYGVGFFILTHWAVKPL